MRTRCTHASKQISVQPRKSFISNITSIKYHKISYHEKNHPHLHLKALICRQGYKSTLHNTTQIKLQYFPLHTSATAAINVFLNNDLDYTG